MSGDITFGQPSERVKEFLGLQFVLLVFEKQGRKNDQEAKEIRKELSGIFKQLSAEEKTFLTMSERLAETTEEEKARLNRNVKLPNRFDIC